MAEHSEMSDNGEKLPGNVTDFNLQPLQAFMNIARSKLLFWMGVTRYAFSFATPFWLALSHFGDMEMGRANRRFTLKDANDFIELLIFEMQLAARGTMASISALNEYHTKELRDILIAMGNSLSNSGSEGILGYSKRQLEIMDTLYSAYPRAIRDIGSEYGLHFDNGGYVKTAETDRFELYQVLPTDRLVRVRENGKPMIVIPPYVLGANILAFLPGEGRSYVHAFANQGIPTYIRVLKDIRETPAVQLMTGEDDATDTGYFGRLIAAKHGKPVTLNGYCQGGFTAVLDILSGRLDGVVDALITCAAPLDGSRSKSLVEYIDQLPFRFRELGYALKTYPNGNRVVDGKILSWVFKLKSIENEAPFLGFYRDLTMFDQGLGRPPKITKSAAAISHWLTYDITDIPLEITRMSFDSYTRPVLKDGTLPVKLFGKPLNFGGMTQKGIKWLICIAEKDDLVDRSAATAPLDFVDAEVAVFPKGHASMATFWSSPASNCSLEMSDTKECVVKDKPVRGKSRGPVRFHLDLDKAEKSSKPAAGARARRRP